MNKPITLCDRCDMAARCLLNYDGVPCRKNRNVEPTNADHIRSMTDEELAEEIAAQVACMECPILKMCERADPRRCIDMWLSWLKSPAEEVE